MPEKTRMVRLVLVITGLALALPSVLDAQVRRGRAAPTVPRWAPVAVGVRFGWDDQARGEIVGAQVRIPIIRNGMLELVPNAEIVFPNQTKEYQYNLELAWVPGGPRGGIVLGAGVGWRSTILGTTDFTGERRTFLGGIVAVGGKTLLGPIQIEALLKWIWLQDTDYRPNSASMGVNYPLWRVGPRPGS